MAYVITSACIGVKDKACLDVCPVDCIKEGADQCYIDPDLCINCAACRAACPVSAIYPEEEVPADQQPYIRKNADFCHGIRPRRTFSGPGG